MPFQQPSLRTAFYRGPSGFEAFVFLTQQFFLACLRRTALSMTFQTSSQVIRNNRQAPATVAHSRNTLRIIHSASCRVQLDVGNKPRGAQPQNP